MHIIDATLEYSRSRAKDRLVHHFLSLTITHRQTAHLPSFLSLSPSLLPSLSTAPLITPSYSSSQRRLPCRVDRYTLTPIGHDREYRAEQSRPATAIVQQALTVSR